MYVYIYIYILRPAFKVRSGKMCPAARATFRFPVALGIPPLEIKTLLEASPLKSRNES